MYKLFHIYFFLLFQLDSGANIDEKAVSHKKLEQFDTSKTVNSAAIEQFLTEKNIKFLEGNCCYQVYCPKLKIHKKPVKTTSSDLFINKITGHFVCFKCGKTGDWSHLVDNILIFHQMKKKVNKECFSEIDAVKKWNQVDSHVETIWAQAEHLEKLTADVKQNILEDFELDQLTFETLKSFEVRFIISKNSLVFPFFNLEGNVTSIKILRCRKGLDENDEMKTTLKESIIPSHQPLGLFGWNLVNDIKEIVLTSTEKDAMAIKQATNQVALTLPKGPSILPQEVLPSFERFSKIVVWFSDDINSWEAAKLFSRKLNHKRCFIIRPSLKSPVPYQALVEELSLRSILKDSKRIHKESIKNFSDLRSEVYAEFTQIERVTGVKWQRYKTLNTILKGHRRGELTVVTGATGSGKTTFISDYSLDLAMQGVNTLWGSFEINNIRLLKMMITQFSQRNFSKNLQDFDVWADKFEELPLYFMTFHGQQKIPEVLDTMAHAVYVHDISHVIVDNLQFMVGMSSDNPGDRFLQHDKVVAGFRRFATQRNCHVTLVIHPRKEKEGEPLTTASIFGSAKPTQEADNIMLLQDKRVMTVTGKKYVQITKNRYDGDLGVIPLNYDKGSMSYVVKEVKLPSDQSVDSDIEN
ncbi:hypothetical protein LOTGIDRAFT_135083 [Lottia gigantea]|uniref:DNA 5'-3' helicase n=1 Tax=Lottia gigantea TaxID=225164 RepID=V3ZDR3_LOTGI|nr:hypothetical protein LOTGIDRAFT_135083 [Lottia gigantea]ESO82182.1 hypothetical protein LOTGIDRAFT_135083 [Lottia gigantea]